MTKDAVLTILRAEKTYVSGEKISSQLGVSRAAVNTAVKTLRAEGYEILSTTNKGYFLNNVPNSLTVSELSTYLPAERMTEVKCLDSVDSTNNSLRELAFSGAAEGQVIIANEQLCGRGRRGRMFESPRDKGIYLSILLRPDSVPVNMTTITAWAAVTVSNAIETVSGVRPNIKWVNDLIMNHKKVCGILTEMSVESESGQIQYVIIGIGLNVNEEATDFSKENRGVATSLLMETGKNICRAQLAAEIIKQLDKMCNDWPCAKNLYLDAYRSGNIVIGKEVTVMQKNGEKSGIATGITDDFALRVSYTDGSSEVLSSGEVRVKGIYE